MMKQYLLNLVITRKMLQYKLDKQSLDILGYELRNKPSEFFSFSYKFILDVGGNTGKLTKVLKTKYNKVISIDIDRDIMVGANGKSLPEIEPIQGNMLQLPFKDNIFDIIFVRAVLHHVPIQLEQALIEIKRVTVPSGIIIIEEPGYHNPCAYVARKAFPTTSHEEGEEPLRVRLLYSLVVKHFVITESKYYWLLSYTMPHIIARLPQQLKTIARTILRCLVKVDKFLLTFAVCRPFCGYVLIVAKKEDNY